MRGQIIPLTIVATFVLGTLAAAAPATDSQITAAENALDNVGPLGEDVLQGDWEEKQERHRWYYRDGDVLNYAREGRNGNCCGSWSYLYDPIQDLPGLGITSGPVTFDWGTITNDFELDRIVSSAHITTGGSTDVYVELLDGDTVIPGATVIHQFDALVSNQYDTPVISLLTNGPEYVSLVEFDPPVVIAEGTDLKVRVSAPDPVPTDTQPTVFNYGAGSIDSYIELHGNMARVNAWTTNNDGVTTDSFPLAQDAPSEDRHIRTWVAHVSALGSDHTPGRTPLDPAQHGVQVRILDKDGNDRTGITDIRVNTRIIKAAAPGMNLVEFDIQYPDNLLDEAGNPYDGRLIIELYGQNQQWVHRIPVAIAGAQVELDLAEFEDATKTILTGEDTTFLFELRNGGIVPDDVIITGDELNGWSLDVLVDSINLSPGESRVFPITIQPPASGLSGDFQSFDIKAISSRTGQTDTETVTVILTDIETNGVDLLASQLETVQISAGQTKSIGLTIKNLGNSAEDFSLSTAGAPLGWKAKLSPSSTELGAKSQSGTLLTVTAPEDAQQGDKFALTVTVRSIVDNTIKDTIIVPYEVFFREDFTLEVSHEAIAGEFQNYITTLADMQAFSDTNSLVPAPGIHTLRDEGTDGDTADYANTATVPCSPLTVAGVRPCLDANPGSNWDGRGDPDIDYDQSTLFRLVLTNHGNREDTVRLTPNWVFDGAWESRDVAECEERDGGNTDGVPDGWRFRYWEAGTPLPPALDGPYGMTDSNSHDENPAGGLGNRRLSADIRTVDLEAGEEKIIWVELGWQMVKRMDDSDNQNTDSLANSVCTEGTVQSGAGTRMGGGASDGGDYTDATKNAVVKFTAESLRDLTKVQDLYVRAHYEPDGSQVRDGSQRYSGQHNQVYLGLDTADYTNPEQIGDLNVHLTKGTEEERTADFHLRVVNAGNEQDTIRVEIPIDTDAYEYFISEAAAEPGVVTANRVDHNPGNPRAVGCTDPAGKSFMDCTLGAFDEIDFNVNVRAKLDKVPIGQIHTLQVRATSLDSLQVAGGAVTSLVTLQALATGTHAFAITEPVVADGIHDVDVVAGETFRVPFVIQNQGTSFDNYQVDLLEQPPADSGWEGIIGFNSPQFVAAGKDHVGFLTVAAPEDAQVGDSETFRVRVASLDGVDVPQRTLRIQANVVAAPAGIELVADPIEIIGFPGSTVDVTYKATRTSGLATNVDFALDEDALPNGWSVVGDATPAAVDYDVNGQATYTFQIQVPSEAIGSSRLPVTATATDSNDNEARAQAVINLDSSVFGVRLSSPEDFEAEELTTNVVAGSKVEVPVRVQNLGGGVDRIALTTEPLPEGWQVIFSEGNPDAASFQPFEARNVIVTVVAPEGVPAGQGIDVVLVGTSTGDVTRTDNFVIKVRTGQSILEVGVPTAPTRYVAPLEEVVYNFAVRNNGTVRDEITFGAGLSAAYEDLLQVSFNPASANLGPGESASVTARLTVPEGFLSGAVIPIKLQATSDGPFLNAFGESSVEVRLLEHRTLDIDNDGNPEYAVDRNRDGSDGFEDYTDPVAGGKASASIDMSQFLTPEAIDDWTVLVTDNGTTVSVFAYSFDLTGDGRIDHFIDDDQDNLPDTFWDPHTNGRDDLEITYDVTNDGVREYFVDVNSDGLLDVWYDITTGQVGQLLKVDVDGDGAPDFVVDLDGDGMQDDGEPVLFGSDGRITKITQSLDVNGDGRPDLVVDEDGDGIPDYFVPAGKTRGVAIVLEDVNGDGVEDWTYDANNDGRRDSYYDPVTGQTGSIDTGSEFIDGLSRYWYVPTLFALVTVLFVVLVVVTRR
ncbi:MAG: NEW3 domain-containing protein [Thermoplasmatota archaeon]